MCKTHDIAKELDVRILKQLRGAEILDVPEGEPIPEGAYLVERDGEKFVLKTGRFNKHEVDDNWRLAELGVRTRLISETMPEEYILYEYIDAPVLATLPFWTDEYMEKVLVLHKQIETPLNQTPITDEEAKTLIYWVENRPYKLWLDESTNNPWTEEEVADFRRIITDNRDLWSKPENMQRASYDTHAENYLVEGDELVVMDADITVIPKHYTDMRYLAWTILKMPISEVSVDWVRRWVDKLGTDRAHIFTFFVSMLGIMWDMHGNARHKGEHIDKTDIVGEIIYWLVEKLKTNSKLIN